MGGETAITLYNDLHDTRSTILTTPFNLKQLDNLTSVDLAIISDITELLSKEMATEWLAMIRNRHTQHIIVISDNEKSAQQGWQLADYLALGLKHVGSHNKQYVYAYAIESYQPKRDWLNSRFWANPENFNKYRW